MLQRLHLAHSSDHRIVALVVSSHTLRVWVLDEGQDASDPDALDVSCALEIQTGHVEILGLSFMGAHTLLCVHANGVVQLWSFDEAHAHTSDAALERARACLPPVASRKVGRGHLVDRLSASPVVSFVAPEVGAILCWELELETRLKSADFQAHPETGTLYAAFGGVSGEVLWMSVSPSFFVMTRRLGKLGSCVNLTTMCSQGTRVASSCRDHRVAIWRPLEDSDGAPWLVFEDSGAEIWALAFSHSTRYLAGGGIDNGIYLWDLEAGSLRAKRYDHSGWISDLAWSDHDRVLASASWDNSVGVYRGNDLMPLYRLELHTDYVSSVTFIPETTLLVSASYDHKLAVWDWSQASLVRVFEEHGDWIQSLVYTGEGRFMSASSDRCVHMWSSSPLALRAALVEGSLKARIENRTVASIPELDASGPAMALRADATPSDVVAALDRALGEDHSLESVKTHLPSQDTSSSSSVSRNLLSYKETWPDLPPLNSEMTHETGDEHTENFSLRKLTQTSESSVSESSLDQELSEALPSPPSSGFASRALRIEGESLTSGRLRSPRRAEESGIHNLQEMSLAVDAVDVFRLMDSNSSPIVIIPSGQSEAFSSSNLPDSSQLKSSSEATREISRDSLKLLFRRHLDSDSEEGRPSEVSEELAAAYSQPLRSPEEITQSLFGDLTEVFEDSMQHYIQLKQDSSAVAAPVVVAPVVGALEVVTPVVSSVVDEVPVGDMSATLSPVDQVSELNELLAREHIIALPDLLTSRTEEVSEPQEDEADEALPGESSSDSTPEQVLSTPREEVLVDDVPVLESSPSISDESSDARNSSGDEDEVPSEEDVDVSDAEMSEAAESEAADEPEVPAPEAPEAPEVEELATSIPRAIDVSLGGLSDMLSSSPEMVIPVIGVPDSEFSEAMLAKKADNLKPNPFTREQENLTVAGEHAMGVSMLERSSPLDEHNSTIQDHDPSDPSLVQPSVSFEEQEFYATPPGAEASTPEHKALPNDELTALADVMSSQPSLVSESLDEPPAPNEQVAAPFLPTHEPSSPLSEDSSATVMHAGATQAAAEQALLQGVFEDAFASLHDAFKSEVKQPAHDPLSKETRADEVPHDEVVLHDEVMDASSVADDDDDSISIAFPGHALLIEEHDDLPVADDAPTMAGSAHASLRVNDELSPAMATLIADEESDEWYIEATPVSPDERTVAEELMMPALPRVDEASLGDLPTNPGDVREHTSSSGHPLPSHTNTQSFSASAFSQEERKRSGTRDARPNPNPGNQTNPGMFSPRKPEHTGAAPFIGRPATAGSLQVDEVSANTTSFGGIVYRPEVVNEPELGGNEITADAFPDLEGAISEAISQSEFISHTPEWDNIGVAELWQLRHRANQSAMKIFKRRASVSRQPWHRHDPVRAGLHNVFAASSRSDADYFAAGGATRHLSVWSFQQELIYQLPATGRIIYALTATPDGRILLSGDDKANIDLWLIDFDKQGQGVPRLKRAKLQGHTAPISHLATNSSGRLLLSAGLDGTARLWNLEDGTCVSVLDHYGESLSACDFWGSGLVSVSLEGVLRLWDRRGIQIDLVEGFSPLTCVAAKRNKIYFGARNGEIFCYERGQTRPLGKHDGEVSGMCLHLDGTLITASRDGSIKIHYDDGKSTVTLHARAPLTCISIDTSRIIAGTENGNVEIFKQS